MSKTEPVVLTLKSGLERAALRPAEAAEFAALSLRQLNRLISTGKIEARKVGSRTIVMLASLRTFLDGRPVKAKATILPCAAAKLAKPKRKRKTRH